MVKRRELGITKIERRKHLLLATAWALLLLGISALLSLPVIAQNDQGLYLPLIPAQAPSPTPVVTVAAGTRVYGLVGTLQQPRGQEYTYYLATANAGYFALAGQTPDVEQQIAALTLNNSSPTVKVWGEVQAAEGPGQPQLIVVTGILGAEATPVTPVTPVAGESTPVAVVKFQLVNLYDGPASTYPVAGQVVQRQACEITGRNQASSWLQLTCADGQQGWVDARLVEVQGDVSSAVVINIATPTPAVTPVVEGPIVAPTPTSFSGWRTEIYNNATVAGVPVAVVDIPNLNFDWGSSGPSQVAPDNFSMRFTKHISVSPGYYQFTAVADDGIRVWVDDRLLINAWPANPSQNYVAGQVLTGDHTIRVEYYELSGLAKVSLDYAVVSASATWQASYFSGVTPSGNPAFTQEEPQGANPLNYNWSTGAPQSSALGGNVLGNDYWSARWTGDFPFEGGNYIFRANVDDGIRLYLDGLLVLNQWRDGYKEVSNRVIGIGPGRHTIVVEYYERAGNASINVWWYRDSAYTGPQ